MLDPHIQRSNLNEREYFTIKKIELKIYLIRLRGVDGKSKKSVICDAMMLRVVEGKASKSPESTN